MQLENLCQVAYVPADHLSVLGGKVSCHVWPASRVYSCIPDAACNRELLCWTVLLKMLQRLLVYPALPLSWCCNVLQFVPQDKVAEFARKKPEELLEETQKAIGDATLYNLHRELILKRQELRTDETVSPAWITVMTAGKHILPSCLSKSQVCFMKSASQRVP